MDRIPPIKSVMTPFPHSIEKSASITRAKEMMTMHGIRHLPVVDGDELIGVVSAQEIGRDQPDPRRGERSVGELAFDEAYVVSLSEPLDRVLREMAARHVEAALVVKGGKLAGIFTVTDACSTFAKFLLSIFPSRDPEDAA
jgi:acetoin utilization protein AcuB